MPRGTAISDMSECTFRPSLIPPEARPKDERPETLKKLSQQRKNWIERKASMRKCLQSKTSEILWKNSDTSRLSKTNIHGLATLQKMSPRKGHGLGKSWVIETYMRKEKHLRRTVDTFESNLYPSWHVPVIKSSIVPKLIMNECLRLLQPPIGVRKKKPLMPATSPRLTRRFKKSTNRKILASDAIRRATSRIHDEPHTLSTQTTYSEKAHNIYLPTRNRAVGRPACIPPKQWREEHLQSGTNITRNNTNDTNDFLTELMEGRCWRPRNSLSSKYYRNVLSTGQVFVS